jgi:hypothetical protein
MKASSTKNCKAWGSATATRPTQPEGKRGNVLPVWHDVVRGRNRGLLGLQQWVKASSGQWGGRSGFSHATVDRGRYSSNRGWASTWCHRPTSGVGADKISRVVHGSMEGRAVWSCHTSVRAEAVMTALLCQERDVKWEWGDREAVFSNNKF